MGRLGIHERGAYTITEEGRAALDMPTVSDGGSALLSEPRAGLCGKLYTLHVETPPTRSVGQADILFPCNIYPGHFGGHVHAFPREDGKPRASLRWYDEAEVDRTPKGEDVGLR